MSPVERLAAYVRMRFGSDQHFENMVATLEEQEKTNIKKAIMYALDEDGHTGDWKLKFADDYINKHYENSTPI